MDLAGLNVLVVGAGKSGRAASRFLVSKGARVTLTDAKGADAFAGIQEEAPGVELVLGAYPQVEPGRWDLVVVSPGVPVTVEPVTAARAAGIPVIGELELAWRFCRAPVVAITGTNGKTTTTALVGEVFRHAGKNTLVAGNIGVPFISGVERYGPGDVVVLEVSSFQLETAPTFRPRVAAILNITPDHIDRHRSLEAYIEAKAAIFKNQTPDDYTVLNYDDPITAALASRCSGQVIFFSRRHRLEQGIYLQEGQIMTAGSRGSYRICPAGSLRIPGGHNLENALAAAAAAWVMGVRPDVIGEALTGFRGVPHRLEEVGMVNGVRYINDSKGTNPDAAIKALEAFREPIVLIAGGRNKGNSFQEFAARFPGRVRALVVLGESAEDIARAAREQGLERILRAADLKDAVRLSRDNAEPGDVVLLSPACASWDMFKSYEERGDLFREIVKRMAAEG
ncbi:UDP-N-acetylmuramoyl-L-alanine--D-glutamate ligase [Desulforudis sp. 1088]|uniref:UDP-N-acetylmuramoyl-L-alanine--D-glutamate ligase n=2 Tax=Candidatus Desulforudis TaxID=471826 RepID=UPI003BC07AF5